MFNLRDLALKWRQHLEAEGKAERTVSTYMARLGQFLDWYEGHSLSLQDLLNYVSYLRTRKRFPGNLNRTVPDGGLSPESVRISVVALKSFCRWLHEEGHLPENVAARLKRPQVPKTLPRYASEEDLAFWLRPLLSSQRKADIKLYAISLLLLDSGLRIAELCGIRMEDVNLAEGWIRVLGKGRRERLVPVEQRAAEALRRYLALVREPHPLVTTDHLFISQSGTALTTNAVQKVFRSHGRRVGVHLTPHMLRHTMATHALRNGYNLFELQKALGHQDLAMTQRYAAVSFEDLQRRHRQASPANRLPL